MSLYVYSNHPTQDQKVTLGAVTLCPNGNTVHPYSTCTQIYKMTHLRQVSSRILAMIHADSQTWSVSTRVSRFCFQRRLSECNGYTPRSQKRVSINAVGIHISGILCDDLHHMLCLLLLHFRAQALRCENKSDAQDWTASKLGSQNLHLSAL